MVGAASLSNTSVIVTFNEPMSPATATAAKFVITQDVVNPQAGTLIVTKAEFLDGNNAVVKLTTLSQNELSYKVSVVNATDVAGTPLAPRSLSNGVLLDPTSAVFRGTPPTIGVDSDGDGLNDNLEMRGWTVTVKLADGTTQSRGVTSDPTVTDTDGDGLNDAQEANLRSDPRAADSDEDQIGDYAEFNEFLRTNPVNPDTDHDTFADGFERSIGLDPTNAADKDTDGDGLPDPVEMAGWQVSFRRVSIEAFAEGPEDVRPKSPSVKDVDSDDDGLTDFEEYFLKTDPLSQDTDGDDLADEVELRGFKLPHLIGGKDIGLITTKPLDADTDDDKRSDGEEAESNDIREAPWEPWVVRVRGGESPPSFQQPIGRRRRLRRPRRWRRTYRRAGPWHRHRHRHRPWQRQHRRRPANRRHRGEHRYQSARQRPPAHPRRPIRGVQPAPASIRARRPAAFREGRCGP